MQTDREVDLLSLQASMAHLLSQVIALGSDIQSQSAAALMETLEVNMHALNLAHDDSISVQHLALDLARVLALGPNSQVLHRFSDSHEL